MYEKNDMNEKQQNFNMCVTFFSHCIEQQQQTVFQ